MSESILITQSELQEVNELERELSWKQSHLEQMKSNLLAMLREGVKVERGRFTAKLVTRFGRAVPWKQAFIERLGQAAADLIRRSCRVHTYYEVEVREYAVLPLWQGHEEDDSAEE